MLPRFQHILVPVDLTEKNRVALDYAFELAVQDHASVTLLHVIEPISSDDDPEVRDFLSRLQSRAATDLETMAQRFQEARLPVEWKTRIGKRASEIVGYADERKMDLIVMNSHRIDLNCPTTGSLGTLSHQVSTFCQCPVMLVK